MRLLKFAILFIYFLFVLHSKANTQCPCISIPLSQKTNQEIIQSNDKIFISSLDGLNITNGITTKYYKPSTHNMIGNILQGQFFIDKQNYIWFTTYNALHKYIPEIDNFETYQLCSSTGELITSDYSIIKSINSTDILIKLKNEIIIYDTKNKITLEHYNVDFFEFGIIEADLESKHPVFIAGNSKGLYISDSLPNNQILNIELEVISLFIINNILWIGSKSGELIEYDIISKTIISKNKIASTQISNIQSYSENKLLVTSNNEIMIYEISDHLISKKLNIFDPYIGINNNYIKPFIDKDSTLWVGIDGLGVLNKSLNPDILSHWPISTNKGINYRLTQILELSNGHFILANLNYGLTFIDSTREHIKNYENHSKISTGIKHAIIIDQTKILASNFYNLQVFDTKNESYKKINLPFETYGQVNKDKNSQLFASPSLTFLIKLKETNGSWKYDTVAICPLKINVNKYTYFFFDHENNLFIDNNHENIVVFDSTHNKFLKQIDISGGLYSLYDIGNAILITNYSGLFEINKEDYSFRQIIDNNNKLTQPIYGVLVDDNGYYWMSTNNGIYRYDPKSNHAHQFKMKDGLQAFEYNTMSYYKDSKGRFLFGGINGLNVFDPLKVKLSDKQAPIDFYNYKINDTDSRAFGIANYVKEFILDYKNNTITFEFVGIDYADSKSVNLKYYMEGYDKDWVTHDENNGLARYANLPTGKYTFNMLASNADEIWSKSPKRINIRVLPPWWETWWFRVSSVIIIASIIYISFRKYFKIQLREKDLLLREQTLIISKQQALEAERIRIAGEMHDDLGGGLTTIKFLSEKVLRKITDQTQKTQIQKIVSHAQNLVSNMSEIIWAMNDGFNTLEHLIAYTRRYAYDYIEDYDDLTLEFRVNGRLENYEYSGEQRRHLFLIIKEAIHNIVKHANANLIEISFDINDQMHIIIKDNGLGLNEPDISKGNGIRNIKNRVHKLHGQIQFKIDNGFMIEIKLPIDKTKVIT